MTFYPRGVRRSTQPELLIRGHRLRQVDCFSYLGVQLTDTSSLTKHTEVVLQRAKVSLFKTTDLLKRVEICNLSRLHCYFQAFIQAQLYGLEIIPFTNSFITQFEHLRSLFVQRMFNLPRGTPSDLFYVLFPSLHPSFLCLSRRLSFFYRALRHDLKELPDSFIFDSSLMLRNCGWFHESFDFYRTICSRSSLADFDFSRDVPALLSLVKDENHFSFSHIRSSSGPCLSFFRIIRHPEGLQKFRDALSVRNASHQHVILCFSAGQLRWTFLSTPRRFCPLCGASWSWEHFFSCLEVAPLLEFRQVSLPRLRVHILSSEWDIVFRTIGHVLVVWSFVLNRDPNLTLSYDIDTFKSLMQG